MKVKIKKPCENCPLTTKGKVFRFEMSSLCHYCIVVTDKGAISSFDGDKPGECLATIFPGINPDQFKPNPEDEVEEMARILPRTPCMGCPHLGFCIEKLEAIAEYFRHHPNHRNPP